MRDRAPASAELLVQRAENFVPKMFAPLVPEEGGLDSAMEVAAMRWMSALAAVPLLVSAWAGSLPKELVHALQRREQIYYNHRIVFRVDAFHDIFQPRRSQNRSRYMLDILRTPRAVRVVQHPLDGRDIGTKQGNTVQFSLQSGGTSTCYLGEGATVAVEPEVVFSPNARSIERAEMLANIKHSRAELLYGNPQAGPLCQEVYGMRGVFTVGLDVSKLYNARWDQVEERVDRWVLLGKAKARHFDPSLPSDDFPDILLRVELRKPDALVLLMEILVPFRVANMWYRHTFRTVRTKRVGKFDIPAVISYRIDTASRRLVIQTNYELLRFEPWKGTIAHDLPVGTTVSDERLGKAVNYKWTGRLLTEDELKALAYQQGRLIPPETPRRYSLWLFLPAILFFLAAAYLYFKGRRK